VYKLSTRGKHL